MGNKLDKAAMEYAEIKSINEVDKDSQAYIEYNSFKEGARWQLDNMWISSDIIPADGDRYLVRCKNGSIYLAVHEEGTWKNTSTITGIEIKNVEAYFLMRKYNKDEL